jgi:nitrite reductase/ring-hydroxylating ferredoxin subunit
MKMEEGALLQAQWEKLCSADSVGPDAPLLVERGEDMYAVFQVGAAYFVIADRCSHGPGSLSEGYVEGHEVECPFHQGRFDIRTGCPTGAPCTVPVATWEVRVDDGAIWIQPGARRIDSGCTRA